MANGQPAFGCYLLDANAPVARADGLTVLTLPDDRVPAITDFADSSVFHPFGLPRTLHLRLAVTAHGDQPAFRSSGKRACRSSHSSAGAAKRSKR